MGSYRNSICKSAFLGLAAQSRPRLGSGDFGSLWEAILLHRFAFLAPLFQEPPSARIWRFGHHFSMLFLVAFLCSVHIASYLRFKPRSNALLGAGVAFSGRF